MVRVKSAPCPLPVNLEGAPVNPVKQLALQFNRTSCPGWDTVINGV